MSRVISPGGGKEHCGPVPTDTLDATAADRAGVDSTSQELGPEAPSLSYPPARPARAALETDSRGWTRQASRTTPPEITGRVDTHGLTHHAAVIDHIGRHLADAEFPATIRGYRDLLDWMRGHGELAAVGVEGTGAYGAEMARVLTAAGVTVIDVDRPDRKTRRMKGKSDPLDAYAAATSVLSGRATCTQEPRRHDRGRTRAARHPPQRGQGSHPGDEPGGGSWTPTAPSWTSWPRTGGTPLQPGGSSAALRRRRVRCRG
jgi:hypothetical protein